MIVKWKVKQQQQPFDGLSVVGVDLVKKGIE